MTYSYPTFTLLLPLSTTFAWPYLKSCLAVLYLSLKSEPPAFHCLPSVKKKQQKTRHVGELCQYAVRPDLNN